MANFWKKIDRPILALAPMAGITDSAFRQICRKHGADVVYSEMASVSALFYKPQKTLELLKFNNKERPYVVQLFGKDPAHFAKAARIVSSLPLEKGDVRRTEGFEKFSKFFKSPPAPLFQRGKFTRPDGIDINFGCPAKKVFGHGSGCALMPQKELTRKIIQAVLDNTDLPVSLKIRAGVFFPKAGLLKNSQSLALETTALDFIKNIRDLDFKAVMVHCRTYEQGFSGTPDYSMAEKIKKIIPDKIVLANGGINTPENALMILNKYHNIDGLGIARGVLGRPWIFEKIKSLLSLSSSPLGRGCRVITTGEGATEKKYDFKFISKIAIQHAKLLYKYKGKRGLFEIRKHLVWYFKGFPGASELRKKLVQVKNIKEIEKKLKSIR